MVQLTVRLSARSGCAHQLIEVLHSHLRHALRQHGCSSAHIAADVDEANVFWYWEDWQDARALEGELRADRFSQLLALVETSTQPPLLEFRVIPETRGLDYVAAVRNSTERAEAAEL